MFIWLHSMDIAIVLQLLSIIFGHLHLQRHEFIHRVVYITQKLFILMPLAMACFTIQLVYTTEQDWLPSCW
jgi:hypothetical protein